MMQQFDGALENKEYPLVDIILRSTFTRSGYRPVSGRKRKIKPISILETI